MVRPVETVNRPLGEVMSYGASPAHTLRITSIDSANIALRSSSRMPSTSASDGSAPGLTPRMKRPSAR